VAINTATAHRAGRTLLYVTDLAVGLNVVAGPPDEAVDSDQDGVIDFFDAFPADAAETLDSDQDGLGNHADLDDDNDGFPDDEERQQGTDPSNARSFPVAVPVLDTNNRLVVDAAAGPRGNGSTATPYGSISAALQAIDGLRRQGFVETVTVAIRAGMYSALHTGESFPLLLHHEGVRLQGEGASTTRIDAAFFADVIVVVAGDTHLADVTLARGVNGLVTNLPNGPGPSTTVLRIAVQDNLFSGVAIDRGLLREPLHLTANQITANGFRGLEVFDGAHAILTHNTIADNGAEGVVVFSWTSAAPHTP
jgi:hypothetical protein